ncbi:MAG TPA: Ppx/GppA phosphatase family protein [Gammaproteobacteria bacterium]|nr:Ppx/GppA phosphatase family protein [Gammaproteobacteria bacterium]
MKKRPTSHVLAAVDLGSNSFHLLVAQVTGRRIEVLDSMREMLRFGSGLDARGRVTRRAEGRALACLKRFGDRLSGYNPEYVRAVGTNTLRRARGSQDFLAECGRMLGHPIEVISGIEEARLIYRGVCAYMPQSRERRLVVDIGGGSTELIVGQGNEPKLMESLAMGSVAITDQYFQRAGVTRASYAEALLAARRRLEPVEAALRRAGWRRALGSSGTIRAVGNVLEALGWTRGDITREDLARLGELLAQRRHVRRFDLPGLKAERAPVFAGGVAVLQAVFEALDLDRMAVAPGALREGVLLDLVGRLKDRDVRSAAVDSLAERYGVDREQADRVSTTVHKLARGSNGWDLGEEGRRMLAWAALLHECGRAVARSGYHKHGAYILANADMAGFARSEQQLLAALVRSHRGRVDRDLFERFAGLQQVRARRLTALLRLAYALHRAHEVEEPRFAFRARGSLLRLKFQKGWLKHRPLLQADLEEETRNLRDLGFTLKVS